MNIPSGKASTTPWATALALVLLMVLTRIGHLGEFSRLPDASWAVFFLGGMQLREARAFAAFFALAWIVDLGAVALGTPADCFSVAYLFLVPSYAALWWGGRLAARHAAAPGPVAALARGAGALWAAVILAFMLSNLGFYAFGQVAVASVADYALRVGGYLPAYLVVATVYAGLALAAWALATRGLARRASDR